MKGSARRLKKKGVTYLAGVEEVVDDGLGHLHEDDLVCDAGGEAGLFGLGTRLDAEERFL